MIWTPARLPAGAALAAVPQCPACESFYDRPFTGLRGVPEVLRAAITDPEVRALPRRGGVEQWVDDVGMLTDAAARSRLAACRPADAA